MARSTPRRSPSRRTTFGGGGSAGGIYLPAIPPIIDPTHPMFAASGALATMNLGSFAFQTANKPCGLAFFTDAAFTVTQLGWLNGSGTMTDNVDMGIYTSAWAKVVTTGSTARSGVSANQWVDITDTPLTANTKYYLVMSVNGTTANQQNFFGSSTSSTTANLLGLFDSATSSFPLPDPLVGMVGTVTAQKFPMMMMATRAVA